MSTIITDFDAKKIFGLVDENALCYTLTTKSVADFSGACRFSPHSLLNMPGISAVVGFFYGSEETGGGIYEKTNVLYGIGIYIGAYCARVQRGTHGSERPWGIDDSCAGVFIASQAKPSIRVLHFRHGGIYASGGAADSDGNGARAVQAILSFLVHNGRAVTAFCSMALWR